MNQSLVEVAVVCNEKQLVSALHFGPKKHAIVTQDNLDYSIKKLICERVAPNLDIDSIASDARLIDDLNFDSLQLLGLITEIESEFNLVLDDEDLDLDAFDSVSNVANFVSKKLAA